MRKISPPRGFDSPARSESLHRLAQPAHNNNNNNNNNSLGHWLVLYISVPHLSSFSAYSIPTILHIFPSLSYSALLVAVDICSMPVDFSALWRKVIIFVSIIRDAFFMPWKPRNIWHKEPYFAGYWNRTLYNLKNRECLEKIGRNGIPSYTRFPPRPRQAAQLRHCFSQWQRFHWLSSQQLGRGGRVWSSLQVHYQPTVHRPAI